MTPLNCNLIKEAKGEIDSSSVEIGYPDDENIINLNWSKNGSNITGELTVIELVFQVKDNAAGKAELEITEALAFNDSLTEVTFEPVNGMITIIAEEYEVSLNTGANGTASVSKTVGVIPGETITVTANPTSGYQLDKITYTPNGGTATDITSEKAFT